MPYQDDWLETLGDILPRMKPLQNPPGADEEQQARTQQHNEALAQLQDNALVARHLAQNTITNGVPFPDSLIHFVPGRLLGPLAAARAGGTSSPWADPSSTGSADDTANPWTSYGNSASRAATQNNDELPSVADGRYVQAPAQQGVMSDAVPEKLQVRNMIPDSLVDMLRQREGDPKSPGEPVLNVYKDTEGYDTFGWGHKIKPADAAWVKDLPTMDNTQKQLLASTLFYEDADALYDDANNQAKQLGITDPNFIQALTSADFQLGPNWLPTFPKTLKLIQAGDYPGAADEVARSRWYTQSPTRVQDFQKALRAVPSKGTKP